MEELVKLKEAFEKLEWASPEWTDKVLALLQENEVAKDEENRKYPRVRGLRRIGSYLTEAQVICDVISADRGYAACKATGYSMVESNGNREIFPIASSTAEATPENVNHEMIAKHLLATAESRAEGRCWTKILKLNCLTAEEMSVPDDKIESNVTVDINNEEEFEECSDIQRKMLNKKCKASNLNIMKYAEFMRETKKLDTKHLANGISKQLASKMIDELDRSIRDEKNSIDFSKQTELHGFESI